MEMIVIPMTVPAILCAAVIWTVTDTISEMTVMDQLHVTAISVLSILLQMRTSMVAVNVTSTGKDPPVNTTTPLVIQSV